MLKRLPAIKQTAFVINECVHVLLYKFYKYLHRVFVKTVGIGFVSLTSYKDAVAEVVG